MNSLHARSFFMVYLSSADFFPKLIFAKLGSEAQSVTCLATDANLTSDPGVAG